MRKFEEWWKDFSEGRYHVAHKTTADYTWQASRNATLDEVLAILRNKNDYDVVECHVEKLADRIEKLKDK